MLFNGGDEKAVFTQLIRQVCVVNTTEKVGKIIFSDEQAAVALDVNVDVLNGKMHVPVITISICKRAEAVFVFGEQLAKVKV